MEDDAERQSLWKMMKAEAGAPQVALLSLLLLMMLGMVLRALHMLTKCSALSSTRALSRGLLKEDRSLQDHPPPQGCREKAHHLYGRETHVLGMELTFIPGWSLDSNEKKASVPFLSLIFLVLGIELRTSYMQGKHFATELFPQPCSGSL